MGDKAIEKGAQLQQIDDVDLSFISFDEDDGDQLTMCISNLNGDCTVVFPFIF
jgi:hypothetical protein